jgi:hypothetical protein
MATPTDKIRVIDRFNETAAEEFAEWWKRKTGDEVGPEWAKAYLRPHARNFKVTEDERVEGFVEVPAELTDSGEPEQFEVGVSYFDWHTEEVDENGRVISVSGTQ